VNIIKSFWNWYKSKELFQWLLIIIPLWLQPIHMWGMGEMVGDYHELIENTNLAHFNFWGDILLLLIDHLEWVSIVVGTEKIYEVVKK